MRWARQLRGGDDRFRHAVDRPERMRQYAGHGQYRRGELAFSQRRRERTVAALAADIGFIYLASPKGFDHSAQTTVLDADGRVYRQVYGQSFTTQALVEPLKGARLRTTSRGCHGFSPAGWTMCGCSARSTIPPVDATDSTTRSSSRPSSASCASVQWARSSCAPGSDARFDMTAAQPEDSRVNGSRFRSAPASSASRAVSTSHSRPRGIRSASSGHWAGSSTGSSRPAASTCYIFFDTG